MSIFTLVPNTPYLTYFLHSSKGEIVHYVNSTKRIPVTPAITVEMEGINPRRRGGHNIYCKTVSSNFNPKIRNFFRETERIKVLYMKIVRVFLVIRGKSIQRVFKLIFTGWKSECLRLQWSEPQNGGLPG